MSALTNETENIQLKDFTGLKRLQNTSRARTSGKKELKQTQVRIRKDVINFDNHSLENPEHIKSKPKNKRKIK